MSNARERQRIGSLLEEHLWRFGHELEPLGQTLLTMDPESWPEDAVEVRVAHRGFEVAWEAARLFGIKGLTLEHLAAEYLLLDEHVRNYSGDPENLWWR